MAKEWKFLKIKLSESVYQIWYNKLVEFFISKGIPEEEAAKKVKEILDEAQGGWPRAPRDIETRIKMKSGYQWKSHNNLKPNADKLPSVINAEDRRNATIRDLYQWEKSLKPAEREWWDKREQEYCKEFSFNNSSDRPLLFQLLVEELTQARLAGIILKDPKAADSYSKLMTESLRRMQEIQVKLGITREQRADELEKSKGDIASLAIDFDEKVRRAKLQIEEWKKEEAKQKFLKNQTGVTNVLPPIEKIEALLGMDPEGNLGVNLEIDSVGDLLDKAADIHDETLEELEQKRGGSIQAPSETHTGRKDET